MINSKQLPQTPPDWWVKVLDNPFHWLERNIRRGQLKILATSPGGRPVYFVAYGDREYFQSLANFNSAAAAGRLDAYCQREKRSRPVILVLAGIHGHEVEGIVAAFSLLLLLEERIDLAGVAPAALSTLLEGVRFLVMPLANPDGRARAPYAGLVGVSKAEMSRIGQGTRRDGSAYGWPGCKAVHPMRGDVGILGAYFDDAGVNLMHDAWHAPMSPVTRPLLDLVAEEAPDMLLNLHSYEGLPSLRPPAYVPRQARKEMRALAERFYAKLDAAGLPHDRLVWNDLPAERDDVVPSFNLNSMAYHTGAALPLVYESPHGLADEPTPFTYGQIHEAHLLLFEAAAEHLLRSSACKAEAVGNAAEGE